VQEFETKQDQLSFDFLFLDINMPNKTGIQLAEEQPKLKIIFTTAYEEYALKSYDVDALDYILKPVNQEKLHKAISKAILHFEVLQKSERFEEIASEDNAHLELTVGRTSYRILKADIIYIASENEYIKIFTPKKSHLIYCRLKEIKKLLEGSSFIQIHRSYIVNMEKIIRHNSNMIELPNQLELPISRSFKKEVAQTLT
jgi:DNA-binding LytR/AlgR family response regulator